MKKKFLIFLAILVLLLIPVSAHSGGTDAAGGHYNHSTGEYHYHHGHPAHQHINGVCPYESKSSDTTEQPTTSGSTSNWVQEHKVVDSKEDKEKDNNSSSNSIGLVAVSALAAGGIGYKLGKRKR